MTRRLSLLIAAWLLLAGPAFAQDYYRGGAGLPANTFAVPNGVATGSVLCSNGVNVAGVYCASPTLTSVVGPSGQALIMSTADVTSLSDGTTGQVFNIYHTFTDATHYEALQFDASTTGLFVRTAEGGSGGSARDLYVGTQGNAGINMLVGNTIRWLFQSNTGHFLANTDNTYDIGSSGASRPRAMYLAGSAITPSASQAAGGTVNTNSDVTRTRYQVTVAPAAGDCLTSFKAAAVTADCQIATLPAGQKLVAVYADVTVAFTCSGTCSGTKVLQAGTAAGGTQILAASLNVATTATYGLADADLGSGMTRAAAIQGGLIGSWSSTTPVSVRFTSGTGNWGNATTTFVNAGTVKFTLITEQVK